MSIGDNVFAASIAELYDAVLGPFMFEPFARETAARLSGLDGNVLEVAAGTGVLTRELDRALDPKWRITATDLNAPMLDVAARKLSSPRITWRQADALALPFADHTFDAVVCQFGIMFYPDKRAGHAEAARVLRSGGQYLVSVWESLSDNPVAEAVHRAAGAYFPDNPPEFLARTPHGHHDKAMLRGDLAAAGFRDISIETVTLAAGRLTAEALARGYCQGTPLRNEIVQRDEGSLGLVTAAVESALKARFGDGLIESTIEALVVSARR
ncbi:MAG TPA: methyltransferase domain-containing protein [Caulobacteraceae bacterium]|jgi:ubiquinone/menaquinone biosynthesis C-methylase UbiE|nr:methyltransferase domain-containing protein [Caulobacteraceae bacterium]